MPLDGGVKCLKTRGREMKERLYLEDLHLLRSGRFTCVSVFIEKWFYYIPRVKLKFVEGHHETAEQADEEIRKSKHGERTIGFPEDYPKNLTIVCRPEELLHFAKTIQNVCISHTYSDAKKQKEINQNVGE